MPEPTKADLKAAVATLTEENAGLRELLAAASECAGTVPVAASGGEHAEWRRSTTVLSKIKVLCALDGGWKGEAAYGARVLRESSAEPVGYEVYAEPEPVPAEPAQALASCGHPANEDGECNCSSWPERAVMAR